MIQDGLVYECVDARTDIENLMNGVVMLQPVPGGFEVWNVNGLAQGFKFEDDDQLEEVNGVVTFHMPEGQVNFVKLTLSDFERLNRPATYNTPKFKSDDQLQEYFRQRIENY
jgi:hypothetical protein